MFAAMAFSAHAQLFISGNADYSRTGYTRSEGFDKTLPQGMALGVSVQVGLPLGDKVKAGLVAGMSHSQYTYTDGFYDRDNAEWKLLSSDDRTLTSFGGGLFLRFRCAEAGSLSFHLELSGNYHYGMGSSTVIETRANESLPNKTQRDYTRNTLQVRLVPVITYAFTHHVGIDIHADFLSIAYRNDKQTYMLPIDILETSKTAGVDYTLATTSFEAALHSYTASILTVGIYYQF